MTHIKSSIIRDKLILEEKEIVESSEIKDLCAKIGRNYETTLRYLLSQGYFVRIFKGVFYVKTLDEMRFNKLKYNTMELVAMGLDVKSVDNWYFGLETALKLNNLTHEYFNTIFVISDTFRRTKAIKIRNETFEFFKWKPEMATFGIIKDGKIRYSDPEKTILDIAYRNSYTGRKDETIISKVLEYLPVLSFEKIGHYLEHYPVKLQRIVEGVL